MENASKMDGTFTASPAISAVFAKRNSPCGAAIIAVPHTAWRR